MIDYCLGTAVIQVNNQTQNAGFDHFYHIQTGSG